MSKKMQKQADRGSNRSQAARARGPAPRGLNHSGDVILEFMHRMKIKGNFRDYVLFIGNQMHDYAGTYTVNREPVEASEPTYIALVHKKDLHTILGKDKAENFWSQKLRRRNPGMKANSNEQNRAR